MSVTVSFYFFMWLLENLKPIRGFVVFQLDSVAPERTEEYLKSPPRRVRQGERALRSPLTDAQQTPPPQALALEGSQRLLLLK